jgi:hypothetical protein
MIVQKKFNRIPKINESNGSNQKEIQAFNNRQVYSKGFDFTTQAGVNGSFPCVLGGSARRLFGINLFTQDGSDALPDLVSLTINKEKIIDNVVWWSYNPANTKGNTNKPEQYYALPRSLGGSDSILLNWNSTIAHKIFIVFYLADAV